jgi:tetratricopeptide (TPR) repeat protein
LANTAESAERQRQKIDLQIELRHALFPTGGFAEIGSVLAKAHEEAEALGDKARLGLVLMHETTHHLGAGRHQEAVQAGIRALAIADELEDNSTRRDILFHLVQANASSGDYSAAIDFGERLVEGSPDGPAEVTTSCLARMWLAWCSAELGRFDEAHAHASAAISASRDSEQPLPILLAHLGRGLVHLREERFADAAAWLEPALSFSHKPSLRGWWGALGSPLGRAWLGLGRVTEAMSLLEKVVAHSASPRGSGHVLRSIHLAEAYLAAERIPAAATLANEAHALARAHGERGHEAYALLLLAELARAGEQIDEAINYAHEARQLCAELQMQPLVRRVAKSLAGGAWLQCSRARLCRAPPSCRSNGIRRYTTGGSVNRQDALSGGEVSVSSVGSAPALATDQSRRQHLCVCSPSAPLSNLNDCIGQGWRNYLLGPNFTG